VDRLQPQNIDAETATLGAILIDATSLAVSEREMGRRLPDGSLDPSKSPAVVMEFLKPEDFYRQSNGRIYAAMLSLYDRGVKPDVVTVAEELERDGELEAVGGAGYLSTLGNDTPDSSSVVQYALLVHRKAVLRRLIGAAGKIAAIGYEGGVDIGQAIERAYLELHEATSTAHVGERPKFEKAGFRAYSLTDAAKTWRLVLSRVEANHRDPEGLITVYADSIPDTFADLGSYALCRSVGLFGGTKLGALAKELGTRLGEKPEVWMKRLDYLIQRSVRESQAASETLSITGVPERPNGHQWLFHGRMRVGRTLSLFGPGSAGKTTIADGLALSACTGQEIIPGWAPARKFPVLVLDWDEGEDESKARLFAMCSSYGLQLENWNYRRMSRPLADCADDVGKQILDAGVELLIVSPVRRAMRDSNGDPGGPVNELYEVLREFGTSNLLIDHVTGSAIDGQREANREYGSVVKRDNARGSYSVYCQSEEPGTRVVVIKNTKPDALSPRHPPQAIRIEFSPSDPDGSGTYDSIRFEPDEVVEKVAPAVERHAPREGQMARFLRLVRESGPIPTSELVAGSGFSAANIRQMSVRARNKGVAIACGPSGWVITGPDPSLGMDE
jgi:hypothetical protein